MIVPEWLKNSNLYSNLIDQNDVQDIDEYFVLELPSVDFHTLDVVIYWGVNIFPDCLLLALYKNEIKKEDVLEKYQFLEKLYEQFDKMTSEMMHILTRNYCENLRTLAKYTIMCEKCYYILERYIPEKLIYIACINGNIPLLTKCLDTQTHYIDEILEQCSIIGNCYEILQKRGFLFENGVKYCITENRLDLIDKFTIYKDKKHMIELIEAAASCDYLPIIIQFRDRICEDEEHSTNEESKNDYLNTNNSLIEYVLENGNLECIKLFPEYEINYTTRIDVFNYMANKGVKMKNPCLALKYDDVELFNKLKDDISPINLLKEMIIMKICIVKYKYIYEEICSNISVLSFSTLFNQTLRIEYMFDKNFIYELIDAKKDFSFFTYLHNDLILSSINLDIIEKLLQKDNCIFTDNLHRSYLNKSTQLIKLIHKYKPFPEHIISEIENKKIRKIFLSEEIENESFDDYLMDHCEQSEFNKKFDKFKFHEIAEFENIQNNQVKNITSIITIEHCLMRQILSSGICYIDDIVNELIFLLLDLF